MGGLLEAGKQPDGLIADYLTKIDAFSDTLASKVNAAYGGVFLANAPGPGSGSTIAVTQSIRDNPTTIVAGSGSTGSNDIANAVSKLRDDPVVAGGYKALVAKVGGDLNEAIRMQSNAQILTDSVEDRRQSVAGVSMDEEMSNLVRFQRAYQASARAMSTMDEMLDVLINRTGRVGL
jgi:flagellar hook-associated protein 1 FlgK